MRWVFSLLLFACAAAATAQERPIAPALYVVRDADSELYLFGVVHVRRPGAPWGGPAARAALAQSDEVWTEIDLAQTWDDEAARRILARARLPEGATFSDFLTPSEDRDVRTALAAANMPIERYLPMRPWYVAVMLSFAPLTAAGMEARSGVDTQITALAVGRQARRRFFETQEEQLSLFSALPMEVQVAMLRDVLRQRHEAPQDVAALQRAWETGDVRTLEREVIADLRRQSPLLYEALFARRNRAWMPVLEAELAGAGVDFVAVGAGHLLGRDGLVALLRARGYRVERVAER